jgi:hypothetical protein
MTGRLVGAASSLHNSSTAQKAISFRTNAVRTETLTLHYTNCFQVDWIHYLQATAFIFINEIYWASALGDLSAYGWLILKLISSERKMTNFEWNYLT